MMGCFSCCSEPEAKDPVKVHQNGKEVAPLKQSSTDVFDQNSFQGAKSVSSRDRGESTPVERNSDPQLILESPILPALGVEIR